MALLNIRNACESLGEGVKPLFARLARHAGIHAGPFHVLTLGGGNKVFGGAADAVELRIPHLGMLALLHRCLLKQRGNLFISFIACSFRKKQYLLRACDSPEKASIRFRPVCVPAYLWSRSTSATGLNLEAGALQTGHWPGALSPVWTYPQTVQTYRFMNCTPFKIRLSTKPLFSGFPEQRRFMRRMLAPCVQ